MPSQDQDLKMFWYLIDYYYWNPQKQQIFLFEQLTVGIFAKGSDVIRRLIHTALKVYLVCCNNVLCKTKLTTPLKRHTCNLAVVLDEWVSDHPPWLHDHNSVSTDFLSRIRVRLYWYHQMRISQVKQSLMGTNSTGWNHRCPVQMQFLVPAASTAIQTRQNVLYTNMVVHPAATKARFKSTSNLALNTNSTPKSHEKIH